jgi:hypothetical protein
VKRYSKISINEILLLLEKNNKDRILAEQIKKDRDEKKNPYPNGWNMPDFLNYVSSDQYIDGFIMEYPHGRLLRQAKRTFYYRGESQIYEKTQSSLARRLNKMDLKEEYLIEEFVAYLRIAEFLDLLLRFEHTQKFITTGVDLLFEQIAQHYGLETYWLDVTSDLEIALFFACCKFDRELKCWRPLRKKDFSENYETKFGVLFRMLTDHPVLYPFQTQIK